MVGRWVGGWVLVSPGYSGRTRSLQAGRDESLDNL